MRALTIRQPWASLIALGYKQFETRSRNTNVRGEVAIHAGKAIDFLTMHGVYPRGQFEIERDRSGLLLRGEGLSWPYRLPLGCVVATARLSYAGPVEQLDVSDDERAYGDWTPGRFAWRLTDVVPVRQPIPAKGKQGWWEWEPTTTPQLTALDARIAAATDPDVAAEYRHYRDRIVSRA